MGTHPIFESDFDCLTERENMLRAVVRSVKPKRTFFPHKPVQTQKDQLDMAGPTSLRKIEREAFEAGIDLWKQYDDDFLRPYLGEGSKTNPFIIPCRIREPSSFMTSL